jgi:polyisoprenyl-phosphate glycosyltransferase
LLNTATYTKIEGPILVLGASGFIGSNLYQKLWAENQDVWGACRSNPRGLKFTNRLFHTKLTSDARSIFESLKPATVFDCIAYGGYLLQKDTREIYDTNVLLKQQLLDLAEEFNCTYIHGGSSSEYGTILSAPLEDTVPRPHTHYAVAKHAAAGLIHLYGKHRGVRCANLRLYAVYGPGEREDNRLIPQLVRAGLRGEYPQFVHPSITRDFVHVDDVCDAYVQAALNLRPEDSGESFNIGTGVATSMRELAEIAKKVFGLKGKPQFAMPDREYDFRGTWCARPFKAETFLKWRAKIGLYEGLKRLREAHEGN